MSTLTKLDMPTKLGAASRCAKVSSDKLSVKYNNVFMGNGDVGAVQANKPAPEVMGAVYYFEMRVNNAGKSGMIGIGFTKEGSDLTSMPGWRLKSIGYHGNDGCIFKGRGKGEPFGPKFTSEDIIGVGIDYASNEFFFTKNGQLVGAVTKKINGPLFPTIGLHSLDEEVEVNFGHKPFVYNIKRAISSSHHLEVHDLKSFTAYDESWKKLLREKDQLLVEKDRLIEKSESLMKKFIEEKDRILVEKDKLMEKSESSTKRSLQEKDCLLAEKDKLIEKSESLMKKFIEEKNWILGEKDKLMEKSESSTKRSLQEKDRLLAEKDKLIEKSESLMKKFIEEKNWILGEKDKLMEKSESSTKRSLQEKDRLLAEKDQVLVEKGKLMENSESLMKKSLEEKDQLLAEKDQVLAEKNRLMDKSDLLTRNILDEKSVFKGFLAFCCINVLVTFYIHNKSAINF